MRRKTDRKIQQKYSESRILKSKYNRETTNNLENKKNNERIKKLKEANYQDSESQGHTSIGGAEVHAKERALLLLRTE
jgi:hypothetical protein